MSGETGDTDELVDQTGSRFEHIAGLLRANEDKLSGDTLALLTSLRAERDADRYGLDLLRDELKTETKRRRAAESSLAAEKLKVAKLTDDRDFWKAADEASVEYIEAMRQRVAALVGLLRRYRNETPLGHQPHMIAHEVDAALATEA